MSQKWKWSFAEAFSVVLATYAEDFGGAARHYKSLLYDPNISEINHDKITGLQSGGGQPVILVHGSPDNAMRWEYLLKNPPTDCHIIAIDRMGFGKRGHEKPDLEADSVALSSFLSQFEKPILVGHSLGGATVARLACHHDISGVVFVASSVDPMLERILPIQKLGNSPFIKWILSRSIRHSNEEMMQLFDYMMKTEGHLGKVTAPVHVVHAQDDYLVPFAHVAYVKKYCKNFTLTSIEKGGHGLPRTRPDLIVSAIESVRKTR